MGAEGCDGGRKQKDERPTTASPPTTQTAPPTATASTPQHAEAGTDGGTRGRHRERTTIRWAGGTPLFTSSRCPPGPGLESSCQIPFGLVVTPLSPFPEPEPELEAGEGGEEKSAAEKEGGAKAKNRDEKSGEAADDGDDDDEDAGPPPGCFSSRRRRTTRKKEASGTKQASGARGGKGGSGGKGGGTKSEGAASVDDGRRRRSKGALHEDDVGKKRGGGGDAIVEEILNEDGGERDDVPVLCLTCLAYLNLYSRYDPDSGLWTCNLCGATNVAPLDVLGSGGADGDEGDGGEVMSGDGGGGGGGIDPSPALVYPVVEYRQRTGKRDQHPTTSSSSSSSSSSICYIFVVDGNLPYDEFSSVGDVLRDLYDTGVIERDDVVGLIVFSATVSVYQIGLCGIASADVFPAIRSSGVISRRRSPHHQLVGDDSYLAPAGYGFDTLLQCLEAAGGPDPADGRRSSQRSVGGAGGSPSATTAAAPAPMTRREQLRLRRELREGRGKGGGKDGRAGDASAYWSSHPFVGGGGGDNAAGGGGGTRRRDGPTTRRRRCTGTAVEFASHLASLSGCRSSRVILLTNGCPSVGAGGVVSEAEEDASPHERHYHGSMGGGAAGCLVDPSMLQSAKLYYRHVGKEAFERGVGIDVYCSGKVPLGLPCLQALVEPSGGYTIPHSSLSSPQFFSNLWHCLVRTFMSTTADEAIFRMNGCVLDIKMSSFVNPTRVVGPGRGSEGEESTMLRSERAPYSACAALAASHGLPTYNLPSRDVVASSTSRIVMGRIDPLATFSIMVQVNDEMPRGEQQPGHAFFQFIARWVERDGQTIVTRVSSTRLPVARNVYDFVSAVDEEVVPVVLAREAVLRSLVQESDQEDSLDENEELAEIARKALDCTVHRISRAYRQMGEDSTRLGTGGGVNASAFQFAFPPELSDALHLLHHVRRGTLLGPPLQSVDDRASLRGLFLRLPLDDCLCMMAPKLFSTRLDTGGTKETDASPGVLTLLEPCPPETMALWDDVILAADHHDSLLLWSGRALSSPHFDPIREQCKQFLLSRSPSRFPMPQLYVLAEGDSMSRRLTSRLAPSHADPPEQQLAHFTALSALSPDEFAALRGKFRFYDEKSDPTFRRWFWSVASANSKAGQDGNSLCD